jgi:Na+/glutamate symporter
LNNIRISKLRSQLFDINNTLGELEEFVNNPDPVRISNSGAIARIVGGSGLATLKGIAPSILKGLVAKVGLAATLGPVGIVAGLLLGGISILFGNRKKKKEAEKEAELVLNKLKAEIRELKELRIIIEAELKTLTT